VIAGTGGQYIVLDALDECTDREDMLTFLHELVMLKQPCLRILATSRREKDIEDQLSSVARHNIDIQSAVVDEDIRVYVRDRLATDTKLKKWPPEVQEEIASVMMAKASGMYGPCPKYHFLCADGVKGFDGRTVNLRRFDIVLS
jgi:hypothetical protein